MLRMLGFPDVALTMAPSVLRKLATGKHGTRGTLSPRQISALPEYLDDPVAIFPTQNDGLLILSSIVDERNKPVVITVRPNLRDGIRHINAITSAFGKDFAGTWLEHQWPSAVYVGEKTNPRLPLPLPTCSPGGALETEGSKQMVRGAEDLRNYRQRIRSAKLARPPGLALD